MPILTSKPRVALPVGGRRGAERADGREAGDPVRLQFEVAARVCGVSMPTSVAADDSLLIPRRPSAAGIRVRYCFSFFHFTTRLKLTPQICSRPAGSAAT